MEAQDGVANDGTTVVESMAVTLCAWARNLYNGDVGSKRRPLPVEIILHIIAFAPALPYKAICLSAIPISVSSWGPQTDGVWFSTRPLSTLEIRRLMYMKLETQSKDQGWTSDPDVRKLPHIPLPVYQR